MAHYMVDYYDAAPAGPDGFHCDSHAIKALNDAQAISEAKNAAIWRKPVFFKVRKVSNKNNEVIYNSKDAL